MATSLSSLVESRRKSGQGVAKSLAGSLKEKLKEKIDPRRLINQKGLLPALFPSLKAYQAKRVGSDLESSSEDFVSSSNIVPQLKVIKLNTEIFTKNTMVLPAMRRDFSSLRSSISKLVKLEGGTPTDKADKYFMDAKAIAAAYKKKLEDEKSTSPQKVEEEKKGFSFAQIATAVAAVSVAIYYGFNKLSNDMQESIKSTLGDFGGLLFDGIVKLFDWSKLTFDEIKDIGGKVIETFTSDEGLIASIFTPEVKKKIREVGEGVISVATGSTSAYANIPPIGSRGQEFTSLDSQAMSPDFEQARKSAENYLGRGMSDTEWNYLLNATKAESGKDTTSYAMVMASILNRARTGTSINEKKPYRELSEPIVQVLTDKNQFEAVTGSKGNGYRPSPNFTRRMTGEELQMMNFGAINILPKVSHEQVNFTAANAAAYAGAGHNIGYRDKLLSQGGSVIGGSVFNTAPPSSAVKPVAQNTPTPTPTPQPVPKRNAEPLTKSSEAVVREENKPVVIKTQVNNTVISESPTTQAPVKTTVADNYFQLMFEKSISIA